MNGNIMYLKCGSVKREFEWGFGSLHLFFVRESDIMFSIGRIPVMVK